MFWTCSNLFSICRLSFICVTLEETLLKFPDYLRMILLFSYLVVPFDSQLKICMISTNLVDIDCNIPDKAM